MQLKNFINKTKDIWGVLFTLIVLAVIGAVCPLVYGFNDDTMMRSVVSGAYLGRPDGHTVYMKYPLSGMLSLLYRVTDAVPWFTLFFAVVLSCCIYIVVKMVSEWGGRIWNRVGSVLLTGVVLALLLFPHYVVMHYTIMAAIFGGTSLFILLAGEKEQGLTVGRKLVSLVLLLVCYMVRSQVFYMTLPFLLVAVLWRFSEKKDKTEWKQEGKSCFRYVLCLLVGVVCFMAVNNMMYGSEEWKKYEEYNEARTELYDYTGLLPYEDYSHIYDQVGITGEQYALLERYGTILDEEMDAGRLAALAEAVKGENQGQTSTSELLKAKVTEYYYRTTHDQDFPYNYVVILFYIVVILCCVWKKEWLKIVLVVCLGGGRSVIWLYLMMRGRYPERVTVSLYLIEWLLLLGMLVGLMKSAYPAEVCKKWKDRLITAGLVVGIALALMVLPGQIEKGVAIAERQQNVQEEWEELRAYMSEHEQDFFYLDVYSTVSVTDVQYRPVEYENYMLLGGWMSRSVLQQEKQAGVGYGSPLDAMMEGENVYLIAAADKEYKWIEEYAESMGYELRFTLCDSVGRYQIYHVE